MKKRLIVIILLLAFTAGVFALPSFAAEEDFFEVMSGLSGSGTESSPYLISSNEELRSLAGAVNSGESYKGVFFALSNDIDLENEPFEPIGCDAERPFAGSFSGRGMSIRGLYIDRTEEYSALFGFVTGDVMDIVLEDVHVIGSDHTAGVIAFGACSGCEVSGVIEGNDHVGGVVGEGAVYDCTNRAQVSGHMEVGGLIGTGDAYRCENSGDIGGLTHVGEAAGLGACFDCLAEGSARELSPIPERAKYSVAQFIRWALTHIDPSSIPTNARLLLPTASCGTSPWKYLFGAVRVVTSDSTLNNYYNNNYGNYMLRSQYDEVTENWSRSTYATDCQGLCDAYLTYCAGSTTDVYAHYNYQYWCTGSGEISSITRQWVVGEAVFVWSQKLGRMGHVGWICGFAEDGEPLVIEAKGLCFGVRVTRLSDGNWTHRGLMTNKFYYDAYLNVEGEGAVPAEPAVTTKDTTGTPRAVWSGNISDGFAGGTGTSDDPYLISNGEELAYLAYTVSWGNNYAYKHFRLTDDIWLNYTSGWQSWSWSNRPQNEWRPIGRRLNDSVYCAFKGSFDGAGHTVYGLFISTMDWGFAGLFGYVGGNSAGTIQNVNLACSFIDAVDNVGGIVGYVYDYGRIDNCSSTATVRGDHWVGGIVGYASSSPTLVVYGCWNAGSVRGSTDTGGIIGYARRSVTVSECTNNTGGDVHAYERVGGIAGTLRSSVLKKCRNNASASGADMLGGLAGLSRSSDINTSYSAGEITASYRAGGLSGYAEGGGIANCFNVGHVSALDRAGGLLGSCYSISVEKSYNVGSVSAVRWYGGAVGYSSGSANASNVYYLAGCSSGSNGFGSALSGQAMTNAASYVGFDFGSVWLMNSQNEYPYAELVSAPYNAPLIPSVPEPTPTPTPTPTPMPTPTPTPRPTPMTPPDLTVPGDADGNGTVDMEDALLVMRSALGLVNPLAYPYLLQGDMDGDGALTAADALTVLRIAMGLIQ